MSPSMTRWHEQILGISQSVAGHEIESKSLGDFCPDSIIYHSLYLNTSFNIHY